MSGFVAGKAVDKLDWDFTAYCDKTAKGTIPEPSSGTVEKFQKALVELGGTEKLAAIETEEDAAELNNQFMDSLIELMGPVNAPSREEIDVLPWRVKMQFIGWIVGKFPLDPRKPTLDTKS